MCGFSFLHRREHTHRTGYDVPVSGQDLLRHPDPKQTIGLQPQTAAAAETKEVDKEYQSVSILTGKENVLEVLTQAENTSNYLPNQLKKKRKKKKKRNLNNNQ